MRSLGQAQQRELLEHNGFKFSSFTRPGSWTATGRREAIKNALRFLQLLTGRTLGRDLLAEVADVTADIVIIDCLFFGAMDVAADFLHGLPNMRSQHLVGGCLPTTPSGTKQYAWQQRHAAPTERRLRRTCCLP